MINKSVDKYVCYSELSADHEALMTESRKGAVAGRPTGGWGERRPGSGVRTAWRRRRSLSRRVSALAVSVSSLNCIVPQNIHLPDND